jgi:hypothetical protein
VRRPPASCAAHPASGADSGLIVSAGYGAAVVRWLGALLVALVLTGFALLLLSGQYFREGPVVATVSENHGIHRGDIGIVSVWGLGMIGLGLTLTSRRPDDGGR